jgi:hypothetical protein
MGQVDNQPVTGFFLCSPRVCSEHVLAITLGG